MPPSFSTSPPSKPGLAAGSPSSIMPSMCAQPISAVLITRNAGRHLAAVLAALQVCDEILVLDSGSQDETLAIAAAAGARIEHQDFLGFGPQKRRAVALARHNWVLSIDGDEILDQQAQAALAALDVPAMDPRVGWTLLRRNLVGGQEIRHGDWVPDLPLRLFHRQHANFSDAAIHESVEHQGPRRRLAGSMLHYSYVDLADVFRLDYHRLKAARYRARGRKSSALSLCLRALGAFFRSYLLRGGWRDGPSGVIIALSVALNASLGLAMASIEPEEAPVKPQTRQR